MPQHLYILKKLFFLFFTRRGVERGGVAVGHISRRTSNLVVVVVVVVVIFLTLSRFGQPVSVVTVISLRAADKSEFGLDVVRKRCVVGKVLVVAALAGFQHAVQSSLVSGTRAKHAAKSPAAASRKKRVWFETLQR